jgi:hypothetical protein
MCLLLVCNCNLLPWTFVFSKFRLIFIFIFFNLRLSSLLDLSLS